MSPSPSPSISSDAAAGFLSIGDVAQRAGLEPSAIRYYESEGLIPSPPRVGGKRRYDASILEWLSLIALAKEAGFTVSEIKGLVKDFTPGTKPAARWAMLAARKLEEIDALVARAERMRAVLRIALDCGCFRLEDCSSLLTAQQARRESQQDADALTRGRASSRTPAASARETPCRK